MHTSIENKKLSMCIWPDCALHRQALGTAHGNRGVKRASHRHEDQAAVSSNSQDRPKIVHNLLLLLSQADDQRTKTAATVLVVRKGLQTLHDTRRDTRWWSTRPEAQCLT